MSWLLASIPVAVIIWAVWSYNRFVRLRNQADEAWSGIDVQLQRRHELVPNLLATVKGYMAHESGVLERVTRLRTDAGMGLDERASAESGLSRSISRLFAVAEDYPDLKASESFMQLHESLVEIEEQLQYARRYYNGSVRDYNILVESFPGVLIAGMLNKQPKDFFEIEFAYEKDAPEVQL